MDKVHMVRHPLDHVLLELGLWRCGKVFWDFLCNAIPSFLPLPTMPVSPHGQLTVE